MYAFDIVEIYLKLDNVFPSIKASPQQKVLMTEIRIALKVVCFIRAINFPQTGRIPIRDAANGPLS